MYASALADGRLDRNGGLSARTVLHHHRVLRAALQQAVRWQLIVRNPADAVAPPRPVHKEMAALDQNATVALLDAARNSILSRPIFIAVTTGLRREELLALRWKHIDLEKASLSVMESLEQTHQGLGFKTPKTRRGRRRIDLPQVAVEELRLQKREQATQKLRLGQNYNDNDLVFAEPDGTAWAPNKLSSAFAALVRRAGITGLRFHDLRHTHATQLLIQGVHPKVVSERLGHATIAITLDTYSHVLPGLQKEAVAKFDQSYRIAMSERKVST